MDELKQILRGGARSESAVEEWLGPVGNDLCGIEVVDAAQAVAFGARAVGAVERKAAWFQLGNIESAIGTGHGRRVELIGNGIGSAIRIASSEADEHETVGHLQGLDDRSFE